MLAIDLAEQIPTVSYQTTGAEAARVVAEYRLSGLVVADEHQVPVAVIPGSQILALILPAYITEDPTLAHAFDEASADQMCARLNHTTIGELLEADELTAMSLPSVLPQDTVVEIASVMVRGHHPLIVVREADGTYRGTVMMSRVLAAVATAAGQDSALIRRRLERDLIQRGEPWAPPAAGEQED